MTQDPPLPPPSSPEEAAGRHFAAASARLAGGDAPGALAGFAEAARLRPGWLAPVANQGIVLQQLGRLAEAEPALRAALDLAPDCEPVLTALAAVLLGLGRPGEALAAATRAVAANPREPGALVNLAAARLATGDPAGAEDACRRALALDPASALASYNLGHALTDQWRGAEALAAFQAAVDRQPGYAPGWHTLLLSRVYAPAETEATLAEAHAAWGRRAAAAAPPPPPATPQRPPRRPPRQSEALRVGYLSPDFRAHSCAHFLEPLFAHHDPAAVEVHAWSVVERPDAVTDRFRALAARWHDVRGLGDAALADRIRAAGIDVLVDLAGHTRGQPLGVFAHRPAPVQVAWLGYPATTGLAALGWRLTDAVADPPGAADRWHAERLVRLPGGLVCYGPPADAPPVAPPPVAASGRVTFGSFNNLAKLNEPTVRLWAALLAAVPGARLLLKGQLLAREPARARIAAAFAAAGVGPDRLELRPWTASTASSLAAYAEVDIALDTAPYNGTTTTLEALWMGVPVVTLRGERHAARVGASLLTHLGRPEWIAGDAAGFVAIARALAADPAALAATRATLRDELAGSTLCDAAGFARRLERVFRELVAGHVPSEVPSPGPSEAPGQEP